MLKQLITTISLSCKKGFSIVLALALVISLTNCAPKAPNRPGKADPLEIGPTKVVAVDELTNYDLIPTYVPTLKKSKKFFQVQVDENGNEQQTKIEIERHFEKPTTVIKTKQASIILDSLHMDKVSMKYNGVKRQLIITGETKVLDKDKKIIGETPFTLVGEHSPLDMTFTLRTAAPEKVSSTVKPVVRAKVTCLAYNENDQTNCSVVIVDFFVAYKMQIYSEQMEISRPQAEEDAKPEAKSVPKPKIKVEPKKDKADDTKSDDKKEKDKASTEPKKDVPAKSDEPAVPPESALQEEGKEDSELGRYVGQTHTDLKDVFEPDDEIQKVIKADTENDDKKDDDDKIKDDDNKVIKIIPVTPVKKAKPDAKAGAKPDAKADVKVDTEVTQTKAGNLRPVNQAVGMADRGVLRNATSLLVKQKSLNENAFFEVIDSGNQNYYGTFEMAELVARLGARINQQMDKDLYISAVSRLKGGKAAGHLSHQNGIDADIGYPTEDRVKFPIVVASNRNYSKRSYSIEKTYDLFKFAFKQPDIKIDRVFVDRIIIKELCQYAKSKGELAGKDKELVQTMFKKLDHYTGHGDHFHLRLKCSSADPACQDKAYFVNPGCS